MLKARTNIFRVKDGQVGPVSACGHGRQIFCVGIVLALLALNGCGTVPLPDYRYYRPKEITAPSPLARPAIEGVLQVDGFRADGVFGERPIAYSAEAEPQRVLQYHYQLWTDPPGAILQRRFIDVLTAMRVAPSVTARASVRAEPYKLNGFIERLERVKRLSGSWEVVVKLRIRVESPHGRRPLLEQIYERKSAATGDGISECVELLGRAVDEIAESVARDLLVSSKR